MLITRIYSLSLLALAVSGTPIGAQLVVEKPSREAIIARFRHQDGLVRSMEAEFRVLHFGTPGEMIPLIKKYYELAGQPENQWKRAIFGEPMSDKDYVSQWWRKGRKERQEQQLITPSAKEASKRTIAYDGQLVRKLYDKGAFRGGIYALGSGDWNSELRLHPMEFLYEFYGMPYSELAARAKQFTVDQVKLNDKMCTRVTLGGLPISTGTSLALFFDAEWRLMQRDYYYNERKVQIVPGNTICRRHQFKDYRPHKDSSGEVIWFPYQVVYEYLIGQLPDGTTVMNHSQKIALSGIRFNTDIQEDRFVLPMPVGARIDIGHDVPKSAVPEGIVPWNSGLPALEPPQRSPKTRSVLLTFAGIVCMLFLSGACFILLHGLKKRGRPTNPTARLSQ